MKSNKNLASILFAGTMALAGCNNVENNDEHIDQPNRTTFVQTAENVRIEPYYGEDSMLMEGIVVTKFAYGDGISLPNIEESNIYAKGSPEYNALRPLLTVERPK